MANIKFDGPEPKIEPPKKRLKKNHYIDDEAEEVKDEEIEEVKDHSDEFPYEEKDQVVDKPVDPFEFANDLAKVDEKLRQLFMKIEQLNTGRIAGMAKKLAIVSDRLDKLDNLIKNGIYGTPGSDTRIDPLTKLTAMCNFTYAWCKSAQQAGVFTLPARGLGATNSITYK